mgnify:CR=1 FL=1
MEAGVVSSTQDRPGNGGILLSDRSYQDFEVSLESLNQWQIAWRRFKRHRLAVVGTGAGLLALSAWCLGVLNSHRRFLLSYAAPVLWNVAMIATLLIFGAGAALPRLAVILAWGSVAGVSSVRRVRTLHCVSPFATRVTACTVMLRCSGRQLSSHVPMP